MLYHNEKKVSRTGKCLGFGLGSVGKGEGARSALRAHMLGFFKSSRTSKSSKQSHKS